MEQKNSVVSIVTVKNKIPLYKGDTAAESIELIELEEVGFELVANKTLYTIGDKAIYIQPDYCLSDIEIFESFLRPGGQENKSMLGKVGGLPRRIRAKKFTLSKEPNGDPVYSNGILLPYQDVCDYLTKINKKETVYLHNLDLTNLLGITKYEEPEPGGPGLKNGQTAGIFPKGIYKTDEDNINNNWNRIEKEFGYPITLIGTEKIDGSSITIGITPDYPKGFICSRNLQKKLVEIKVTGRRSKTIWETLMFWTTPDLNIYQEIPSVDDFVKTGLPYLNQIKKTGYANIILRGELNGGKAKGSGNKYNPASKEDINIKFFGIDYMQSGVAIKDSYNDFLSTIKLLGFPIVKTVFKKEFNSKEEIQKECNDYFKENKIEGIVIRSEDSTFSVKFMNLEYDSKK